MTLPHDRRGAGEPLLLVHGTGSRRSVWRPLLAALARSHEVFAPDLPGHGDAELLAPGVAPGNDALTDALVAFLDDRAIESPHVAGNSLGGRLALELAARGRARSVTALSPTGFWNAAEAAFTRGSLVVSRALVAAGEPLLEALLSTRAGRTALLSQFAGRPWAWPPSATLEAARGLAATPGFAAVNTTANRGRFEASIDPAIPVTVAWGERDRLMFPRQGDRATAAIRHARVVRLPRCGHVPTWDDPPLVAETILRTCAAAAAPA